MKTLILFALTMAASAQAQQSAPCLQLKQAKIDHRVLYQGGTTDIKLKFAVRKTAPQRCRVLTESPALGRQVPVLEIQDSPDVRATVKSVGALQFGQSSSPVLKAREISAIAALSTSPDAVLGEHKLTGTVRYKVTKSQGDVSDEVLSFDVPVKIEPRFGTNTLGFSKRHPVWDKVLFPFEVVAFIALIPLIMIAEIAGWDGC